MLSVDKRTLTCRLVSVLSGSHQVKDLNEATELKIIAYKNKLYLPFLRALRSIFPSEWAREEARFKWYISNTVEVVRALSGLDYALYKFRKPVDHVSVDLDILVNSNDISKAAKRLIKRGFHIVVKEPYTVTLARGSFIVDLYTYPAFAWIIYMDGERLLKEDVEEIEINGFLARSLTRDAEAVVAAAHAIYKEHIYLLIDYLVVKKWAGKRALRLAYEYCVEDAMRIALALNKSIDQGLLEAPVKIGKQRIISVLAKKFIKDSFFRATSKNLAAYLLRRDIGRSILDRLTRQSY